jgi:hypothetical protein
MFGFVEYSSLFFKFDDKGKRFIALTHKEKTNIIIDISTKNSKESG